MPLLYNKLEKECNVLFKSAINIPIRLGGRYIKTISICVSPGLKKSGSISIGDLIGHSSTKEILIALIRPKARP